MTQVWFYRLQPHEVLRFIMDVSQSCAGPCAPLSPAGTRGDKLLSLHLGRSSTYSTISAAISANGCVTLFQIDQLQCVGRGLSHLLNQLWAITFCSQDLFCGPSPVIGCHWWVPRVGRWSVFLRVSALSKSVLSQTLFLSSNSTLALIDRRCNCILYKRKCSGVRL